MKIIDQTPFYKEDGSLSLVDRSRAIMKFGAAWIKEVEAERTIISVLGKSLDKKFTLLHNIVPVELGTMVPLILVGPTGVYVLGVNSLPGMFSARGNQWGVMSGGTPRPEKPNLLSRTERMARAIQVYLQRQGYADMYSVEPVLVCSDPATNVDSVRPIIRVVMRDALERFAVSVSQARLLLSPESVADIINRLTNPTAPPQPKPVETPAAEPVQNESMLPFSSTPVPEPAPATPDPAPLPAWLTPPEEQVPAASPQVEPPVVARRPGLNRKQWVFLIIMALVWILIVIVLAFLIGRDFLPQLSALR